MRKASLQKGLHHAIHPVKFTVDACSNENAKESCAISISARNEDHISWKFQKSFNELAYMQFSFNDLRIKSSFPTYKNDKKLAVEITAWLNEIAEACILSMINYQILLTSTDFQESSTDSNRKSGLSASHASHLPTNTIPLSIPLRLLSRPVVKAGYLLKLEGHRANQQWRRMYVVFSDNLRYYDSEAAYDSGAQPRGMCKLDAYAVVKAAKPNDLFEFSLLLAHHASSVTFRAVSMEELECWCSLFTLFPDCV